jgi:hypothetical protein
MSKKITATDEDAFRELLEKSGSRCQMEYRVGKTTSFGRCPEIHLEKSKNPGHKGICQLAPVTLNRTKKVFCQWCARQLIESLMYAPVSGGGRALVENAAQVSLL